MGPDELLIDAPLLEVIVDSRDRLLLVGNVPPPQLGLFLASMDCVCHMCEINPRARGIYIIGRVIKESATSVAQLLEKERHEFTSVARHRLAVRLGAKAWQAVFEPVSTDIVVISRRVRWVLCFQKV
jgi:hypothetical protein